MWTRPQIGQTWVMNFEIEEWEIPPGADASNLSVPIEFGPVEWNGAETIISARTVKVADRHEMVFFRPHCGSTNFIILAKWAMCPYYRHYLRRKKNPNELQQIIEESIQVDSLRFGRSFYVADQFCIFSRSKFFWSRRDIFFDLSFSTPEIIGNYPSPQIFQWVSQQWQNPNSDVRYAWEWSRKTEAERRQYIEDNVPHWRELMNLTRALVIVEKVPRDLPWSLKMPINSSGYSEETLARLQLWRELLKDRFFPFEPFSESSPQCLNDYFEFISTRFLVKGEDYSAHQQLEARLYLRDWLQCNAPDHLHLI